MRARLTLFILSVAAGVVLSSLAGCHGRHVAMDRYEPVHRAGYVYQRLNDGEVVVAAATARDLDWALKEIGCGKEFVCLVEPLGDVYQVLQRTK